MFLRRLVNLADRIPKTPPGYQMVPVAWSVDLDAKGGLVGLTELGEKEGKKKARRIMMAPHIGRSGGISDNSNKICEYKTIKQHNLTKDDATTHNS